MSKNIDPPYNTGSDGFVYNDRFDFTVDELMARLSISESQAQRVLDLTKRGSASHAAWLMFMYPRLQLTRDLLSNDGVIFISIDDNEQAGIQVCVRVGDIAQIPSYSGVLFRITNLAGWNRLI